MPGSKPSKAVLAAVEDLARRDTPMRKLIAKVGPATLQSRHRAAAATHFAALAESILYQQLAGRAAAAIHARFLALFEGTPTPEAVLALPVETLRAAGLSGAKAASIRDLADKVASGVVELDRVAKLPDDELVRELTLVRGIGRWTAEMFLIFQLGRLDVWPVDDFGVRKGYTLLYRLAEMPKPKELDVLGERFRPYRSVAAWYLWRAADTVTPG